MFTTLLFLGLLLQCLYAHISDASQCNNCDCSKCSQNQYEIEEAAAKYKAEPNYKQRNHISLRSSVDKAVHKQLYKRLKDKLPLLENQFTADEKKPKGNLVKRLRKRFPANKKTLMKEKQEQEEFPNEQVREGSTVIKKVSTGEKPIQNALTGVKQKLGEKTKREREKDGPSPTKKILNTQKPKKKKSNKYIKGTFPSKKITKQTQRIKNNIGKNKNDNENYSEENESKDNAVKTGKTVKAESVSGKTMNSGKGGHVHIVKNTKRLGKKFSELQSTSQNPKHKKYLNSSYISENKISNKNADSNLFNKPQFTQSKKRSNRHRLLSKFNKSLENYKGKLKQFGDNNVLNSNNTTKPIAPIVVQGINNSLEKTHDKQNAFNVTSNKEVRNLKYNNSTLEDPSLLEKISKEIARSIAKEQQYMSDNQVTHERLRKARVMYTAMQTAKKLHNTIEKVGSKDPETYAKKIKEKVLNSDELSKVMGGDNVVTSRGLGSHVDLAAPITDYMKLLMARSIN